MADEFARNLIRTSTRVHEVMAADFWKGADALGHIVAAVEQMGNEGWDAIQAEGDAADKIVIEGVEVIRALRVLAMRLDRAVMVKCGGGD